MPENTLLLLLAVFIGGAAPWLEAIIVIPAGIAAGLNPLVALIAGVTGNLITVAVAVWLGERLRSWWTARRERRLAEQGEQAQPGEADEPGRRERWIRGLLARWGLPSLAVIGPLGLGTQASAVVAVGVGYERREAFLWIGGATIAWGVTAAVLTVTGLSLFGVGG
jgi:uncharacterized membrane protein